MKDHFITCKLCSATIHTLLLHTLNIIDLYVTASYIQMNKLNDTYAFILSQSV